MNPNFAFYTNETLLSAVELHDAVELLVFTQTLISLTVDHILRGEELSGSLI